jgi:hypothetical protein
MLDESLLFNDCVPVIDVKCCGSESCDVFFEEEAGKQPFVEGEFNTGF